jgi:pentafunctional AROM polypeptide
MNAAAPASLHEVAALQLDPIISKMHIQRISILGQESLHFGMDILPHIVQDLVQHVIPAGAPVVIITDVHVAQWHMEPLRAGLEEALARRPSPSPIIPFIRPAGEATKTRETKGRLEDAMLAAQCTRDTVVIALGGGVIGDLAGM